MRARFGLVGLHRPVVVLTPETPDERILLAAFLRYDANVLSVDVERAEDGQIHEVTLFASVSE